MWPLWHLLKTQNYPRHKWQASTVGSGNRRKQFCVNHTNIKYNTFSWFKSLPHYSFGHPLMVILLLELWTNISLSIFYPYLISIYTFTYIYISDIYIYRIFSTDFGQKITETVIFLLKDGTVPEICYTPPPRKNKIKKGTPCKSSLCQFSNFQSISFRLTSNSWKGGGATTPRQSQLTKHLTDAWTHTLFWKNFLK